MSSGTLKEKGDFTAGVRLVWIAALALGIGAICAFIALLLLWLIALFTILFYYHQLSITFRSPAEAVEHLG